MVRPRSAVRVVLAGLTLAGALVASPAGSGASSSGPVAPVGFVVTAYANLSGGLVSSLAFGPDRRLYATVFDRGEVAAIRDVDGVATASTFATGFRNPLGVLVGPDGAVFVADSEAPRPGVFGERAYGRVWRVRDTNGDGVGDLKEIVLRDLPNGRHNTNGMALGRDGLLYVTNGNSTDDGVEGGPPEVLPWSGSVVRVDPAATDVSLASLDPAQALVATGMRNIYDVAFSPVRPWHLFMPTNGVDDARPEGSDPLGALEASDDLLYVVGTDEVATSGAPHFGFPSCLYNQERQGNLNPYDNPHPKVIEQFGACPTATVPRPVASFGLHVSADGLAFQATNAWGGEYRNDLFVAEFGNLFGDEVVGHKVVRVELDKKGKRVVAQSDFLSGLVSPLDLTFDASGRSMYVADLFTGLIYKVTKVA